MSRVFSSIVALTVFCAFAVGFIQAEEPKPPRFEFTRMIAHWANYGHDEYLPFVFEAQPELAQLGFYGGHFWSLSHTPAYKGYPAHFPVQGIEECGDWFAEKNRALHKRGIKVVGHFNVEFLVGDPDGPKGPTGFFKFYRDHWDEKQFGPKPVADPMQLLERNVNGQPISQKGYGIGGMREYWACLRNPHWQTVLKAWVKHGIDRGLDGFIANYFYRHDCHCQHCQAGFRKYLKERFTAAEMKTKLGIDNLDSHKFKEIVYWHKPAESTPLRREMLRWSQISNKQVFDEVFHRYGRSLKPDLITAQWNHLSNFSQINGDERCLLPADVWGKDESYLWYSTGAAAFYTDLEKRFLGEATLQARYIRGTFDDKPFTLGKYESTRIRTAISELAANGGAPMGFYTRFTDPLARKEIVRYYQFLKRYDRLYRGNRSYAEAVLLYPRSHVHAGNIEPVEKFRKLGTSLLDAHVLFDVLPDDAVDDKTLSKYRHVFRTGGTDNPAITSLKNTSRFTAPYTVRVSASQPAGNENELTLHFVNYNRIEPPRARNGKPSAGGGIKDEKPIVVSGVRADLLLPKGYRATAIEAFSPEKPVPVVLKIEQSAGRVKFSMPEFLVYGVVNVKMERIK